MTFVRCGSRSRASAQVRGIARARCICTHPYGPVRTIPFGHVVTAFSNNRSSAVAISIEKKRDFPKTAARQFRVPSQITQKNQPPAARPTALLLSRHRNWALSLGPFLHLRSPFQVIHSSVLVVDRARQYWRSGVGWSPQSFVLRPACHAGAHVRVGIARPHIQSRAIDRSLGALSPARYRALRIRFDPPQPTAITAELVLSPRC